MKLNTLQRHHAEECQYKNIKVSVFPKSHQSIAIGAEHFVLTIKHCSPHYTTFHNLSQSVLAAWVAPACWEAAQACKVTHCRFRTRATVRSHVDSQGKCWWEHILCLIFELIFGHCAFRNHSLLPNISWPASTHAHTLCFIIPYGVVTQKFKIDVLEEGDSKWDTQIIKLYIILKEGGWYWRKW